MLVKLLIVLELFLCHISLPANTQSKVIDAIVRQVSRRPGELLIASDFNGVLVGDKSHDMDYDMDSLISDVIRPVTDAPGITLYVSSSKPAEQLQSLLGEVDKLGLSAEHYMEVKHPGSSFEPTQLTRNHAQVFLDNIEALALYQGYERQLDKGNQLKSHYYSRNFVYSESLKPVEVQRWFDNILLNTVFEAVINPKKHTVMVGSLSRGKENLLTQLLQENGYSYAIALGDKPADMNAMNVVKSRGFIGIIVGENLKSAAQDAGLYHLKSPKEVHKLFLELAKLKRAQF